MNEKTKCYCVDARIRMCGKGPGPRLNQVLFYSALPVFVGHHFSHILHKKKNQRID